MWMHDAVTWLLAGLAGAALGTFFFGSLWWTVRRTVDLKRGVFWHFAGLLLRMGVTLSGFYLVGAGQWERLVACLAGFVVARGIIVLLSRRWSSAEGMGTSEVKHAPQP